MKSTEFCYWLQGYFELSPAGAALTAEQTDMVRRHLNLVFKHEIDPMYGDEKQQAELNTVHSPMPSLKPGGGLVHSLHHPSGDTLIRC